MGPRLHPATAGSDYRALCQHCPGLLVGRFSMPGEESQEVQKPLTLPSALFVRQEWHSEKSPPPSLPPALKLWLRDPDKSRELPPPCIRHPLPPTSFPLAWFWGRRKPGKRKLQRCPRPETMDFNTEQRLCSKTGSSGMRTPQRHPRTRTQDINTGLRPCSKTGCPCFLGKC